MTAKVHLADGRLAPWIEISDPDSVEAKPRLHFSPANGIPAKAYMELFGHLDQEFTISAFDNRGVWANGEAPPWGFRWNDHANDMIQALEQNTNQPVIAVGHSIGGTVSCIAAARRPDLFSKIIIIDPASVTNARSAFISQCMPQWLSFKTLEFIRRTHHRKQIWPSREAFYENYRSHPTYKDFTNASFRNYVEHGLAKQDDGRYKLVFDPHWESYNFRKVHFLWSVLPKLTMPTLVLRAEHTYMYSQATFDKLCGQLPNNISTQVIRDGKHLAPLEQPESVAEQILDWLE